MNISQPLIDQNFYHKLIYDIIGHLRNPHSLRYQDVKYELWYNCLWTTNYGFISYKDIAEIIELQTLFKAQQLPVKKINTTTFKVKGVQRPFYIVKDGKCNCPLYNLRKNRFNELPQFFKHFKTFPLCHHLVATLNY